MKTESAPQTAPSAQGSSENRDGRRADRVDPRSRTWTLAATSLGFAIVQLDVSVVNVAIKPIGAAFGGGVSAMQWVVSAYTVTFAAFILSAGALGDRIGAKRVFIGGFFLFTVASAVCGLAPSVGVLIAARAAQGVGAAVLVPCSLTLLNHSFPEPGERARAVGLWAAGASAALSAGPLAGGVLTAAFGWRAIFFINAPLGVMGILLTVRWAAETSRAPDRGVDVWGQLAAIVCLALLAAATIEAGSHGFGSPGVVAGYAVSFGSGTAFVLLEARRRQPMLPLRLFRSTTFSSCAAIGLLLNVSFYGLIFVLSLFFQRAQHLSPLQTGLAFAPMTVAVIAANVLARHLVGALRARWVVALGALLMAAANAALLDAGAGSSYPQLLAQLVGLGFGIGLIVPVMTSSLLGSVDRSRSGVASGTLNTARQTGSVLGVALYGSLIAGGRLISGFHLALAVSLGLAVCVLALTAGIEGDATR